MWVAVRSEGGGEDELLDVEVLLERGHSLPGLVRVEERLHVSDLDVGFLLVQLLHFHRFGI